MAFLLPQRENTLDNVKIVAEECALDIVHYVSQHNTRNAPHSHAKTMRRTVDDVLTRHEIGLKSLVGRVSSGVFQHYEWSSSVDGDLEVDLDSEGSESTADEEGGSGDRGGSSDGGDSGVEEDHQPPTPPPPAEPQPYPATAQLKETLTNVARSMFADNIINWGRIATLYAFAGAIAKHMVEERGLDIQDDIAACVSGFVNQHLAGWILARGGWVSISGNTGK